jgi:hypothetical protein
MDDLSPEEIELFELAYHLHMPVYKLLDEMPYEEFVGWSLYFNKRPLGWREDNRASLLMMSSGAKIVPEDIFPSLSLLKKNYTENKMQATLKKSKMFQMMSSATGHKIPL